MQAQDEMDELAAAESDVRRALGNVRQLGVTDAHAESGASNTGPLQQVLGLHLEHHSRSFLASMHMPNMMQGTAGSSDLSTITTHFLDVLKTRI